MLLKDRNEYLFLAVEQEAGKYENNVMVIINPRTSRKSKQWLVNEYPKLNFCKQKKHKTSVNEEKYKVDSEYNEELQEFLRPTLESKAAKKTKIFGKSMKPYAQALGIKENNEKKKNIEKQQDKQSKLTSQ